MSFFFSSPRMSRITRPSFIIIKRFPCTIASRMLCVTIIAVKLCSVIICSDSSRTFAAVLGSNAAVCSSSRSSFGFFKVAIKRVSACLCPPESNPTLEVILSSSPRSNVAKSSLYSFLSFFVIPQLRPRRFPLLAASARFSWISIVAVVPVIGSWNTRPKTAALLCSGNPVTSSASIKILPESIGQTPAIAFNTVDLPAPFPPITVTKSPSSNWRSTPFNAFFSLIVPRLNVLWTSINSNIILHLLLLPFGRNSLIFLSDMALQGRLQQQLLRTASNQ